MQASFSGQTRRLLQYWLWWRLTVLQQAVVQQQGCSAENIVAGESIEMHQSTCISCDNFRGGRSIYDGTLLVPVEVPIGVCTCRSGRRHSCLWRQLVGPRTQPTEPHWGIVITWVAFLHAHSSQIRAEWREERGWNSFIDQKECVLKAAQFICCTDLPGHWKFNVFYEKNMRKLNLLDYRKYYSLSRMHCYSFL